MSGYTPLFSSIVASTIWRESKETKIVWITMLAMADARGIVEASLPGLADLSRVSLDECKQALERLMSPDEYSSTKEHEGRRIEVVDGGWVILNIGKFRDKCRHRANYMREYRSKRNQNVTNVTTCNHPLPPVTDSDSNSDSTKTKKKIIHNDESFWTDLKAIYTWLDVDREKAKMSAWLLTPKGKGRSITKRFAVNWLNRIDKPLVVETAVKPPTMWELGEKRKVIVKRIATGQCKPDELHSLQAKLAEIDKEITK